MTFADYLRSLGFDQSTMSADAIQAMETAWRASLKGNPAPAPAPAAGGGNPDGLDSVLAEARQEQERKAGIAAMVRDYLGRAPDAISQIEPIGRMAIEQKWSVKETEFHLLKATYTSGPMSFSKSAPEVTQSVLEAAFARATGLPSEVVEKSYTPQTLEAADRHFRGGCSLQRMLVVAAKANGERDPHVSNMRNLLAAAFNTNGAMASTGFGPSTYSVGGILSNVANKFIKIAFDGIEQSWRSIAAVRPVGDFKQITSYSLTGDMTYKKLGAAGEVKQGTFGETSYTNQADIYALMLGLDYRDIRNDDLGAFNNLLKRLGRGAALTINDVFWLEWLADQGTFWSAANGNYFAATDYAFALEGLDKASTKWNERTDPDGQFMADEASVLLVPPALEHAAMRFMTSQDISNDSGKGARNTLAGKWTVVMSRYLAKSSITNNSASNYFLVADPNGTPAIEIVFLDGNQTPTIETSEPDLNRLGIQMRGLHSFGVNKQEPRAAMKFKQTA